MVNIDHKKIRRHIVTTGLQLAVLTMLWACNLELDIGPQNYAAYLVGQVDFRQDAAVEFDKDIVAMAASGETLYLMQNSAVLEIVVRENPETQKLEFDDTILSYALPLGFNMDYSRFSRTRQYWQVFTGVSSDVDVKMLYNTQTGDQVFLFRDGMSAVLKQALRVPEVIESPSGFVLYNPGDEPDTADMPLWRVENTTISANVYDIDNPAMQVPLYDIDGYIPILASTDMVQMYVLFQSPPRDTFPYIDFRIRSWYLGSIFDVPLPPETGLIELHPQDALGGEELWDHLQAPVVMEVSDKGILLCYPTQLSGSPAMVMAIYKLDGSLEYVIPIGSGLVHNSSMQLIRSSRNTVSIMRWQ